MLFKKSALTGLACVLLSLPLHANANLITYNNTEEDSAVRTTAINACSGDLGDFSVYTKKHDMSSVSVMAIRILCKTIQTHQSCSANIFMSQHCEGKPVANATIDVDSQNVTSLINYSDKYIISYKGSTVTIDYAKQVT